MKLAAKKALDLLRWQLLKVLNRASLNSIVNRWMAANSQSTKLAHKSLAKVAVDSEAAADAVVTVADATELNLPSSAP